MILGFISWIIDIVCDAYTVAILVYCVMTWLPLRSEGAQSVFRALGVIVNPYLNLFRKFIPTAGGVDFSPIVAILVLQLISWLL